MDEHGREPIQQRLKSVREAAGLTQLQFLGRLNQAAAQLGLRPYAQSVLSRLENGLQQPTFDDVAVFAAVDPLKRGKLWLGWGESADARASGLPVGDEIQLADGLTLANLNRYPADVIARAIEALQREEAERATPARPRKAANDRKRRR